MLKGRKFDIMTTGVSAYEHLSFGADGEPVIKRAGFKVKHLIREHVAYGWNAEEMALNHPQLTLGEVYSALAWYADHAGEVHAKMEGELSRAESDHAKPENRRIARLLQRSGTSGK
ncbi:MAG TPA: DUF433 domain-containing protein [Verrucomicrobiales bacterium]|nr:DUF433 domain-containing protein [Verrucomicrobiales bacterium]